MKFFIKLIILVVFPVPGGPYNNKFGKCSDFLSYFQKLFYLMDLIQYLQNVLWSIFFNPRRKYIHY